MGNLALRNAAFLQEPGLALKTLRVQLVSATGQTVSGDLARLPGLRLGACGSATCPASSPTCTPSRSGTWWTARPSSSGWTSCATSRPSSSTSAVARWCSRPARRHRRARSAAGLGPAELAFPVYHRHPGLVRDP
uniref:Uncharacterized protein n=1 Tax=Phenylobacterium glaciei TaxID=2803784 RepID=A0A974P3D7_9CAUL|nr:hypothetical protein JKL49_22750 [Phenylobacterium glaciei]